MYEADGLGLAAPQVGKDLRLALMDISHREGPRDLIVLVNPKIIHRDGMIMSQEGCLSFPKMYIEIPRSEKIVIQYSDQHGKKNEWEAEGIAAIAIQHELDHLDGRLIIDYLSKLKRIAAIKRWKAVLKEESTE